MSKIAVIGSKGYVGSALFEELGENGDHIVIGVTRENYAEMKAGQYDIIINCAMPSGRFWAKNNPEKDFIETVEKTANLVYGWKYKKFVQISSVSARCQLDTVYGRHKSAAEDVCNFGENLIIRLGALYSNDMKKGVILDMLQGKKVFVDRESRYSFISLSFCVAWIVTNFDNQGIVEIGGKNAIALNDVAKHMQTNIKFEGEINHLDIKNEKDILPEATDVLSFVDQFFLNTKK